MTVYFIRNANCIKYLWHSSDKSTESPLAAIEKPKLTKKNSCPRVKNDPQPEEAPRKKPRLKSFNSAFSSDVLKRYAVSETNLLGEQGDPSQKEMGAEISRAPNYSDLNNVDSDTWIYSLWRQERNSGREDQWRRSVSNIMDNEHTEKYIAAWKADTTALQHKELLRLTRFQISKQAAERSLHQTLFPFVRPL